MDIRPISTCNDCMHCIVQNKYAWCDARDEEQSLRGIKVQRRCADFVKKDGVFNKTHKTN